MDNSGTTQSARLGQSIAIKGEISGKEDLFIDGKVEGTISLEAHQLSIGANGQVRANVSAGAVVIAGNLQGNVRATDRAELRKSAVVTGDIAARRVTIEDGAFLKGSLEIMRESAKLDRPESESKEAAKITGAGPGTQAAPNSSQAVTKSA